MDNFTFLENLESDLETAKDEIEFFEKLSKHKIPEDLDFCVQINKITNFNLSVFKDVEKIIGRSYPEILKNIYRDLGDIRFGGFDRHNLSLTHWENFSVSLKKTDKYFRFPGLGLMESIDISWGGRPELLDIFTADELKQLDEKYYLFAIYIHNSNFYSYLFFDRDHNFSYVNFDQDGYYSKLESLLVLKDKTYKKYSLVELLKYFAKNAIENAKEHCEEE